MRLQKQLWWRLPVVLVAVADVAGVWVDVVGGDAVVVGCLWRAKGWWNPHSAVGGVVRA